MCLDYIIAAINPVKKSHHHLLQFIMCLLANLPTFRLMWLSTLTSTFALVIT